MPNYYEEDYREPEELINLKENGFEAKVIVSFSPVAMELAANELVKKHIERNIVPELERKIKSFFVEKYNTNSLTGIMEKIIREKFNETYPDVVENKVNELAEMIKNMKFDDRRNGFNSESLTKNASDRVNNYITNELAGMVKIEKDKLTKFSEQYFAQNLFKAMGMMSKLTGEIEQGALNDKL